ncbi:MULTISPECIES: histidine phosphatase family protein [Brevundimonas]|uniref:histidine phosphatase family protein n=1 Tax=Brevundimonas TaxID=41275 RepID=UPI000F02ED76|nr:histidine phosphatase family protein [Brevundimonas lutea]
MATSDPFPPDIVADPPAAVIESEPAGRRGAIILARHGEPALSRKCLITSDQYRRWWADYEVGGLLPGQTPPPHLIEAAKRAGVVLSSTRPRAVQTAAAVAAGREVASDALFIEAPLPPPRFPSWVRLSPRWWGVISRIWWWAFDHHQGEESRREAEVRADRAAEALIGRAKAGHDVLVLAHGYFNHMVGRRLKTRGWRCTEDQGFKYWSTRTFRTCGPADDETDARAR